MKYHSHPLGPLSIPAGEVFEKWLMKERDRSWLSSSVCGERGQALMSV